MYTLEELTAMNIFGLLHVSACFSCWTVTAKYFLGAILCCKLFTRNIFGVTGTDFIDKSVVLFTTASIRMRNASTQKPSQGGKYSGKFLVGLYSLRCRLIQHYVGRGAPARCLACKYKLSLWINKASS